MHPSRVNWLGAFLALMACATGESLAAGPLPEPKFDSIDIDTKVEIGYGLAVADVDGDKKPDILLADKARIVWYRNPTWTPFVIAEKLTDKDHVCIAAADIDGDGRAEIAVGAEWNPGDTVNSGAVFYLVAPADRTQKWKPVKLSHEPTVHRMRWLRSPEGGHELVMVPLHGRGNKNGAGEGVRILTYRLQGNPLESSAWTTSTIMTELHMTHNFNPTQWDGDSEQEFLLAGKEGVFHFDRTGSSWQGRALAGGKQSLPESPGAGEIRDGRLPGGARYLATVEPMHGNSAVIYAEEKSGGSWKRLVVDESIVDGHAVGCGDLLGLGYDQLVVGWRAMSRPGAKVGIRLYTPLDATGSSWRTSSIDDNTMACEDLLLADMNGDGKLDLIAAGRATRNVKLYLNQTSKR